MAIAKKSKSDAGVRGSDKKESNKKATAPKVTTPNMTQKEKSASKKLQTAKKATHKKDILLAKKTSPTKKSQSKEDKLDDKKSSKKAPSKSQAKPQPKSKTNSKVPKEKKTTRATLTLTKAKTAPALVKKQKKLSEKGIKKLVKTLPFQIGEYIFYPNEGLGRILNVEELELQGEMTPYYVIEFASQKMINRVPIKNVKMVKIRKIISKQTAKNVLKIFDQEPEKSDMSWKDRLAMYQTINEKGDSIEMAQMIVSLFYRRQIKHNLSFQERQVYEFSLGTLADEVAVVLGQSSEKILQEINERLLFAYNKFSEEDAN